MVVKRNVLVTGAAGFVGRAACAALVERGHRVRAFDRIRAPHGDEIIVGDLTDRKAVDAAARGMDVVIHLAATPDEDDFLTSLLPNNVVALYHVCEAAAEAKVQRLVLASSGQVVSGLVRDNHTITLAEGMAPGNYYATTKVWAEAVGQMIARREGMSVIAARLGWLPRDRESVDWIATHGVSQAMYLSPVDTGRFFVCCVESPTPEGFVAVFVTSKGVGYNAFDPKPAREILGYEALDTWPANCPQVD